MPTYFTYAEPCQDIEAGWKQFYRAIYIQDINTDGVFYFSQEGSDVKIQLQAGQEYSLNGLKQICYHKNKRQPTFRYELRR